MKKILLVCKSFAWTAIGFTQNIEKEFLLSEYRSSERFEYEKYSYNSNILMSSTDALLINDNLRYRDTLTYDVANNVIKLDGYQQINGNWTHVYYLDYE